MKLCTRVEISDKNETIMESNAQTRIKLVFSSMRITPYLNDIYSNPSMLKAGIK